MIIQHNIGAMNTSRQLNVVVNEKEKTMEKLSSGYQINRAADDAAGLSISEKMRKQIRGLERGIKNTEDGISLCQVADGALAEVSEMLNRLERLTVQAANGTNSLSDRSAIQQEVDQIIVEIDRIGETTSFNQNKIFYTKEYIQNENTSEINRVSNQNKKTDEEIIYEMLRDRTYPLATQDIILPDGQVIDQESANEILKCLSAYTSAYEISLLPIYDATKDNLVLKRHLNQVHEVVADFAKYSDNETRFNQYLVSGINTINTTIDGSGSRANFATAQFRYSDAYNICPANGTNNDIAARMAAAICDLCASQKSSTSWGFNIGNAEGEINCAASSILNKAGITNGVVHDFFSIYTSRPETLDKTIEAYKYIFGLPRNDSTGSKFHNEKDIPGYQIWIQSGAEKDSGMYLEIDAMNANVLGIDQINVLSENSATKSIDLVAKAQFKLLTNRSKIGAYQNRLEHTVKNEKNIVENTVNSESKIRDTDMAKEMVAFSNRNILAQSGQSMLAQANQSKEGIMSLLI